jgi:hypothetical protein
VTQRLRAGLADLASEATSVDMRARVRQGARRVARRNLALGMATALLLVAGSVAGFVTLWPTGFAPPPGPGQTPSPEASASLTPTPSPVDLSNATFTVPTYPGPWATPCPGGEYTFADGVAEVRAGSRLVIADTPPLHGDLDGVPGEETVIMVQCATEGASNDNALAVRVEPGGAVTALGWVNVDAGGGLLVLDPAEPIEISGGSVRVLVTSPYDAPQNLDKQTRAYQYRDGRMVQSDGPTTFAAATTDASAIDLNNRTVYLSTNDEPGGNGSTNTYMGTVRLSNGSGTAYLQKVIDGSVVAHVRATVRVVQTLLVRTGARQTPVAVLEVTPDDAPARTVVMAYHHSEFTGYAAQEPWTVFTTAPGEAAPSVTADTDQLVVQTDSGTHSFRFNPDPVGARWSAI